MSGKGLILSELKILKLNRHWFDLPIFTVLACVMDMYVYLRYYTSVFQFEPYLSVHTFVKYFIKKLICSALKN
jgi:hypothetical protein